MQSLYIRIIFVLFHAFVLSYVPVQATTTSQYAEMATALAAIPCDIAAQHATLKNKQPAPGLHIVADILTLSNKILFLYNNLKAAQEVSGRWTIKNSNFLVNTAFLIRGLVKLDKHLKLLKNTHDTQDDMSITFEAPALDGTTIGIEQEREISQLAYAFEVVALPSLKGLTAFVLACTQRGATQYASLQARNLATAAHSLVNLTEEYTALKQDSGYKKLVAALLFVNTVWLLYDLRIYILEVKRSSPDVSKKAEEKKKKKKKKEQRGDCGICMDEKSLQALDCGHAYCKDCLAGHIRVHYTDKRGILDQTPCPNCKAPISRDTIESVTDNDQDILAAYDQASAERKKPKKPGELDEESNRVMRNLGAKPCPQCRIPVEKIDGCNYIHCRCGHEFCHYCLANYRDHVHAYPICAVPLFDNPAIRRAPVHAPAPDPMPAPAGHPAYMADDEEDMFDEILRHWFPNPGPLRQEPDLFERF